MTLIRTVVSKCKGIKICVFLFIQLLAMNATLINDVRYCDEFLLEPCGCWNKISTFCAHTSSHIVIRTLMFLLHTLQPYHYHRPSRTCAFLWQLCTLLYHHCNNANHLHSPPDTFRLVFNVPPPLDIELFTILWFCWIFEKTASVPGGTKLLKRCTRHS